MASARSTTSCGKATTSACGPWLRRTSSAWPRPRRTARATATAGANNYLWLGHSGLLRPDLLVETIASAGEVERRRNGRNRQVGEEFAVADSRALRLAGIKQIWSYEPAGRFSLEGGFELRQLDSTVEYSNERRLSGALAPLRARPSVGSTRFDGRFDFNQVKRFLEQPPAPLRDGDRPSWACATTRTASPARPTPAPASTSAGRPGPRAWCGSPGAGSTRASARTSCRWRTTRPRSGRRSLPSTASSTSSTASATADRSESRPSSGASAASRVRYENLFDPVTVFPELRGGPRTDRAGRR